MSAIAGRYLVPGLIIISLVAACTAEKPVVPPRKPEPAKIVKPRREVLTPEQRKELGFPADLIAKVESAAGTDAEPFFVSVVVPSENLKGEKGFEKEKLAGFNVRTKEAEELITSFRAGLRVKGYLIFRSHKSYGDLPDVVTVVKGNNSYDILKIQGTEAPNYRLDTKAIIAWLKNRQKEGTFSVTGAGSDWVEARFIKAPANMRAFAKKVLAFAPDVMAHGPRTAEKLAEKMKKTNSFYLEWD
ncbi:MAG TPA: DUF4253 domain-containing protein [Nitrospirota bacterium]|nr:DUF4253 domain-containing protein [Nitrospirota bacterium]